MTKKRNNENSNEKSEKKPKKELVFTEQSFFQSTQSVSEEKLIGEKIQRAINELNKNPNFYQVPNSLKSWVLQYGISLIQNKQIEPKKSLEALLEWCDNPIFYQNIAGYIFLNAKNIAIKDKIEFLILALKFSKEKSLIDIPENLIFNFVKSALSRALSIHITRIEMDMVLNLGFSPKPHELYNQTAIEMRSIEYWYGFLLQIQDDPEIAFTDKTAFEKLYRQYYQKFFDPLINKVKQEELNQNASSDLMFDIEAFEDIMKFFETTQLFNQAEISFLRDCCKFTK